LSEIIREIDNCWSAGCPSPPVGRDGNKRGGRRWWVGFYIFFPGGCLISKGTGNNNSQSPFPRCKKAVKKRRDND
jgi:hypothetical protein